MTQRTQYPDGGPCWADLATPDRDGSRRFYGPLLGWTFDEPNPALGGYMNARRDGKRVAGIMQLPPAQFTMGWGVHLKTSDIEASARKIEAAGGTLVMAPHDIADLGRNLLALDPTGALFGLWQPVGFPGAELDDEPGAPCWNDMCTRDAAATDRFYGALFNYDKSAMEPNEQTDSAVFSVGGEPVFSRIRHLTGPVKDLPSHWLAYFAIEDMDAAMALLPRLEGKLVNGPYPTPFGRIAVITDPYGAMLALAERPAAAR